MEVIASFSEGSLLNLLHGSSLTRIVFFLDSYGHFSAIMLGNSSSTLRITGTHLVLMHSDSFSSILIMGVPRAMSIRNANKVDFLLIYSVAFTVLLTCAPILGSGSGTEMEGEYGGLVLVPLLLYWRVKTFWAIWTRNSRWNGYTAARTSRLRSLGLGSR